MAGEVGAVYRISNFTEFGGS